MSERDVSGPGEQAMEPSDMDGAIELEPVPAEPGGRGAAAAVPAAETLPPLSPEDASLLELMDRLTTMLERSDLLELEVESGGTAFVLRKPGAIAAPVAAVAVPGALAGAGPAAEASAVSPVRVVRAPLTGIFYSSSSPSAPPYVSVGGHVEVGQVIGLIEAMKLFNEIKSDHTGTVARVLAESGKLVKARQPLIEVEP